MKIVAVLLLFLGCSSSFAQDVTAVSGRLLEKSDSATIPYAHIRLKRHAIGVVSNTEGYFHFSIAPQYVEDTLTISSIGFKTFEIPVKEIRDSLICFLEKETIELRQVVITALSAREIVRKSIERIPQNYFSTSFGIEGYYLTATLEDGKYVRMLESAAYLKGNTYSDKSEFDVSYLMVRKSQDYRKYEIPEQNSLEKAFGFDHIKFRRGFLNPGNMDDWDYRISDYLQMDNKTFFEITANFRGDKQKLLHEARLFIKEDDLSIIKIEYSYQWLKDFPEMVSNSLLVSPVGWKGVFQYSHYNGAYCLSYFNFENELKLLNNQGETIGSQTVFNEFVTRKINHTRYPEENHPMNPSDIYSIAVDSNTIFWRDYKTFTETNRFRKALADIDSLSNL